MLHNVRKIKKYETKTKVQTISTYILHINEWVNEGSKNKRQYEGFKYPEQYSKTSAHPIIQMSDYSKILLENIQAETSTLEKIIIFISF